MPLGRERNQVGNRTDARPRPTRWAGLLAIRRHQGERKATAQCTCAASTDSVTSGGEALTEPLEKRFPTEVAILATMFSQSRVAALLPRLNEIHEFAERKWRDYVARLPEGKIKYLLIAEAPPWSPNGVPQYVLDPGSYSRTLMRALRKVFLDPVVAIRVGADEALAEFARQGFLIVDSIPFSMDYSGKRSSTKYGTLVGRTARTYLQEKLTSPSLAWSRDLRVAFSIKLNALAIMKALSHQLTLGETNVVLVPEMVAVNGAGYPDPAKLRAVYNTHKSSEC